VYGLFALFFGVLVTTCLRDSTLLGTQIRTDASKTTLRLLESQIVILVIGDRNLPSKYVFQGVLTLASKIAGVR